MKPKREASKLEIKHSGEWFLFTELDFGKKLNDDTIIKPKDRYRYNFRGAKKATY